MKVCPVCQYEEEQDSETSCAICGSDFSDSSTEIRTTNGTTSFTMSSNCIHEYEW